MQNTGIGGHKIGAYVSVNPKDIQEVKTAIYLFGSNLLGVQLPLIAQDQLAWRIPPMDINGQDTSAGSWGGHGIPNMAYDYTGTYVVTWGQILFTDWNFFTTYFDEVWAVISPDFINGTKPSPNGFDMNALVADLNAIQQ